MSESEEKPAAENKKATEAESPVEEVKQDDKNKALDKAKKAAVKPTKTPATALLKKGVKKENAEQKGEENGDGDKKAAEDESEMKNDRKAAAGSEKKVKKSEEKEDEQEEGSEEEEEEDEDEDEDDEDAPKKKPLLDMPLEVSGARERKKVERLTVGFNVSREKSVGEGEGEKLSEIPNFDANLSKFKPADLKPLHKLLFNRPGTASEIKKNIRSFNGFSFKSFSPDYEKKKGMIEKFTIPIIKKMCDLLFLEKSGTKEDISVKLLDFLMKPESSATSVKSTKSSAKKSEKAKPRPAARSSGRKKKSKSYAEVSDSENEEENEVENEKAETEEHESEESEKMESDEKEDTDDDWDKGKKKGKAPAKKANAKPASKKEESRKADKEAPKEKKAPARSKAKQKKAAASDDEEGSSDDDEPLAKKSKKPPTDEELKTLIKKILDGANLEEITMKTVCKQVYASFPDFDLSDRKEFIKGTVRSIIS